MAADELPSVAVPGHVLGSASKYTPGPGTHTHQGNVVSSLLGRVHVTAPTKAPGPAKRLNKITAAAPEELPTLSVARHGRKREILPDVNNVVLARVVRLMPKQAIVVIQQVGDTVLQTEWQGVIRVQDVRATEKDKVKMYESFKPGDIVKAQVVRCFFWRLDGPLTNWVADLSACRFRWETRRIITCPPRPTSWVSLWRRARPATTWCP